MSQVHASPHLLHSPLLPAVHTAHAHALSTALPQASPSLASCLLSRPSALLRYLLSSLTVSCICFSFLACLCDCFCPPHLSKAFFLFSLRIWDTCHISFYNGVSISAFSFLCNGPVLWPCLRKPNFHNVSCCLDSAFTAFTVLAPSD